MVLGRRPMACAALVVLWTLLVQSVIGAISWSELQTLREANGLIRVTESNYELVSKGAREFYSMVLVTSSVPNSKGEECGLCAALQPTFDKVVDSFHNSVRADEKHLYQFFLLDVSKNPTFVKEMRLRTIPHFFVYPPSPEEESFAWARNPLYQYEVTEANVGDAMKLADFAAKLVNVRVRVPESFDVSTFFSSFVGFTVVFVALKKLVRAQIAHKSRYSGCLFALLIIMVSITGLKFTQINRIPFLAKNDKGAIMFFAGSMSWQFGIEIVSVSLMYLLMASCVLLLIWLRRGLAKNHRRARIILIVMTNVSLFYAFSYFLSCYKIKLPDYPYAI
ncbi:AaceriAER330Wp [[Ashbya] aceris (nom. inval.)]|nr:AaceriAER330Wp [[Ashbya] aceris (nom. inval.)]